MTCGNDDLPRSYLIKQCKEELGNIHKIIPTPGREEGAQLDFMTELQSVIRKMVKMNILLI